MEERYNESPIALSEGKVFIKGIEAYNHVKFEVKVTPTVWEGAKLGERTSSTRYTRCKITGSITHRVATPWLEDAISKYLKTGVTPEFTMTGIMDDKGSDYYRKYGSKTVTVVGCVLTGDITLMSLDASSDGVREDTITFNAKDVIY